MNDNIVRCQICKRPLAKPVVLNSVLQPCPQCLERIKAAAAKGDNKTHHF